MYHVLVCDDETDIVNALKIYLTCEGLDVVTAANGREALEIVKEKEIHLAILDIMMPIMDGIEAMVKIRQISNIPVILLTAKSEDTDKILGLNVGADDYITKPFSPVEVIARVKAQLRRYMTLGSGNLANQNNNLSINGVELNDESKQVFVYSQEIKLTPLEYEILKLLMTNSGKVFSSKEIYRNVWKNSYDMGENADGNVAVHIRHLREKIEINPAEPNYIKVIWGQGYKFERAD